MPARNRDRQVQEEANHFVSKKTNNPKPCNHHQPSLEELQRTTFSDFVRNVVLQKAQRDAEDSDSEAPRVDRELMERPPIHYNNGIAKVTLPPGFNDKSGIANDETGRGPDWADGSSLGNITLPSPIKQCVRGIGGIYEFTFLDQLPIKVSEFRKRADEYFASQVGGKSDMSIEELERKFWRRLGPTQEPSMYGADMNGTLFGDDDCCGWNISKMRSCLQLLQAEQKDCQDDGIPGVTTPYLYFGMWGSVFCTHTEDMNLLSINYLHAGSPKVWYAVAAGEDAKRLEQLYDGNFHEAKSQCSEYMRHKRCLVSPMILRKAGISFTRTVQYPGDAIITFPGSYHFGFNSGFNTAEATNFAVPEWVPYGKLAHVCLCRPDSVRIHMNRFERLLLRYEKEVKQKKRLPWKDWAMRMVKKKMKAERSHVSTISTDPVKGKKKSTSQRTEMWIEVETTSRQVKSRKRKQAFRNEIWHLAKRGSRKGFHPDARVLFLTPIVGDSCSSGSQEDEDEHCFAGVVVAVRDDHARIRMDGCSKKDDVWVPLDSPKLFLDGGRWGDEGTEDELPPLHYWREEDSKRRCA
ncbi:MAG: hypothetical protein SGBAC_010480 [Bacillariaceae sp.]